MKWKVSNIQIRDLKVRKQYPVIILLISMIAGVFLIQSSYASTILYVTSDGSDIATCTQSDPCSIQHAVDLANSGSHINVASGIYTTDVDSVLTIEYKDDIIIEGPGLDSTSGMAVLDGQNTRRVIKVLSSGTLTISGVVIKNGYVANGLGSDTNVFGAGMLADRTALVLSDIEFINNKVYGENTNDIGGAASGGGLAIRYTPNGTTSVLSHIIFENNQAIGGMGANRGGYALGGGFYTFHTVVDASDITLRGNQAIGGESNGSGDKNGKADALGGGYCAQGGTTITFNVITATNNIAQGGSAINAGGAFGGALFSEGQVSEPTNVTIRDAVITDNQALGADGTGTQNNGGHAAGGGGQFDKSTVIIERAYVNNNQSIGGDGSNRNGPAGGGGLYFQNLANADVTISLKNIIIADNLVRLGSGTEYDGGGGGGVWVQCMPYVDIEHATIVNNRLENQGQGEGWTQGSAFNIGNDGCSSNNNSDVAIKHSIIAGHSESYALWVKLNNTVSLHKILWSSNKANTNQGVYGSGTINEDGTSIETNSVEFLQTGNYHLSKTSPAVDQATDSIVVDDIDGDLRPYGNYADIGADEFVPDKADLSTSTKTASLVILFPTQSTNHMITYTITFKNTGTADVFDGRLMDMLPLSGGSMVISNPDNLNCSSGNCQIDGGNIVWTGAITAGTQVEIQYVLNVNLPIDYTATKLITNTARLIFTDTENNNGDTFLNSVVIVNPYQVFLPLVLK